jgi:hypothetical protein
MNKPTLDADSLKTMLVQGLQEQWPKQSFGRITSANATDRKLPSACRFIVNADEGASFMVEITPGLGNSSSVGART